MVFLGVVSVVLSKYNEVTEAGTTVTGEVTAPPCFSIVIYKVHNQVMVVASCLCTIVIFIVIDSDQSLSAP
jgi:uncharacterized membrane protein (UPF0182 family)